MSWITGNSIISNVNAGKIKIEPFDKKQCNPNSYDYRLAPKLKTLIPNSTFKGKPCLDPRLEMKYEEVIIPETGFLLETEKAYIGYTVEKFGSDHYASLVTGKSSIGRLFINNHSVAGLVDQGFHGHITLEITVKLPVLVFPNMRFGQIFWFTGEGDCALYNGKYNNDSNNGTMSKIMTDWSL